LKEEKIIWKRKKSAVLEKKEDQGKTAENLMTQIIKDLNREAAKTEEPAKTEENLNPCHSSVKGTFLLTRRCQGDGCSDNVTPCPTIDK
jgi:hypothetical protein